MGDRIAKIDTTPKYLAIEDIIGLVDGKGLDYTQTAKILGVTKQAIQQQCKRHGIVSGRLKKYRKYKGDIIELKEAMLLNALSEADTNKASLMQKATTFAILYDKGRLESDKSTANINVQGVLTKIDSKLQDLEEERERLKE